MEVSFLQDATHVRTEQHFQGYPTRLDLESDEFLKNITSALLEIYGGRVSDVVNELLLQQILRDTMPGNNGDRVPVRQTGYRTMTLSEYIQYLQTGQNPRGNQNQNQNNWPNPNQNNWQNQHNSGFFGFGGGRVYDEEPEDAEEVEEGQIPVHPWQSPVVDDPIPEEDL